MKRVLTTMASFILIVCAAFALTACKKNAGPDSIESVQLNNVQDFYQPTDSINFDNVTLTAKTKNGSTITYTHVQYIDVLDDLSQADENAEFVLFTDGLHGQEGPYEERQYKFSVYVVAFGKTFTDFKTVEVTSDLSTNYDLALYKEPEFVTTFKTNNANAVDSNSATNEANFYESVTYCVGDDNKWQFKPIMQLVNKHTDQAKSAENFKVRLSVLYNGDELIGTVDENRYFTFSQSDFTFQFVEGEATGKEFVITMWPNDFTKDEQGHDVVPATLTVKVEDGYNISQDNVMDLGRMSLISDAAKAYIASETYAYNYFGTHEFNIYYIDGQVKQTNNTCTIWEQFYASKGVTDAAPVNGIFIHGDLAITPDDLPQAYFISEDEAKTAMSSNDPEIYGHLVGTLRDFSMLYNHILEHDFTFNGNLFQLDFKAIPWGMTNRDVEAYYLAKDNSHYLMGHSTIFGIIGDYHNTSTTKCTFINTNIKGNLGNLNNLTASTIEKASGSIIAVKVQRAEFHADNCLVKQSLIGFYSEDNQNKNLTGQPIVEGANNGLHLNHVKVYDCYNCGAFSYHGANNDISNSYLTRFGGPAVYASTRTQNDGFTPDVSPTGNSFRMTAFTVDENTYVSSGVIGDEAWFVIYEATDLAPQLILLSNLFAGYCGQSYVVNMDGVNKADWIGLQLEDYGPASTKLMVYGYMSFGDENATPLDTTTYPNDIYAALNQCHMPVFMTNGGTLGYINIDFGNFNNSTIHIFEKTGDVYNWADGAPTHQALHENLAGDVLYIAYPVGSTVMMLALNLYTLVSYSS